MQCSFSFLKPVQKYENLKFMLNLTLMTLSVSISSIHFESNPFFTIGTHALRIMLVLKELDIHSSQLVTIHQEGCVEI